MSYPIAWLAAALLMQVGSAERPQLLENLIQHGIELPTGERVPLPPPAMPDGLDAASQMQVLEQVADRYPLAQFMRPSVVAPFVLHIESVDDGTGQRTGQRVDFYFVAYGSFDALLDDELFRDLAGVQEGSRSPLSAEELTDEALQARGLTTRSADDLVESYVAIEAPVLERFLLTGVGRAVRQRRDESLVGAWILDDRFAGDADYPNRWRPIGRDELGRDTLGEPVPYSGVGGYIKVTRLAEPEGALFVECHAAFHEPYEWFDGRNLLRSKLPLVVQDNVRTFRRKLATATDRAAPAPEQGIPR